MVHSSVLLLLCVVSASQAWMMPSFSIPPGEEISQCLPTEGADLKCPAFQLISANEEYEVRKYAASRWVSTRVETSENSWRTMKTLFTRLFRYITGNNNKGVKIPMTAPVITKVEADSLTMSFFVPSAFWEDTPLPTDETVFLEEMPELTVFIRAFSGHSGQSQFSSQISELSELVGVSPSDLGYYYTAGYDAPWTMFYRRNEVWMVQN